MQTENQKAQRLSVAEISTLMPEVKDDQTMYFRRI